MQKNYSLYDSIDDIIGFLNEGNKTFKEHKETDSQKLAINEKSILEEQNDSLSEFQANYEEENKKKKNDQNQMFQLTNENFHKNFTSNDSFINSSSNK